MEIPFKNYIVVRVEHYYGKQLIYPEDSTAKMFTEIAGTKTITAQMIAIIKSIGFEIRIKQDDIKI